MTAACPQYLWNNLSEQFACACKSEPNNNNLTIVVLTRVFWDGDSVLSETDPGCGGVAVNVPVGESADGAPEEVDYSFFWTNTVASKLLLE